MSMVDSISVEETGLNCLSIVPTLVLDGGALVYLKKNVVAEKILVF